MSPEHQKYVQRVRAFSVKKNLCKARNRFKKSAWLGDLCGVNQGDYLEEMRILRNEVKYVQYK